MFNFEFAWWGWLFMAALAYLLVRWFDERAEDATIQRIARGRKR